MLKTRIKRFGTLLMFILLLSMAADGGLATGGSDASSSKSTEEQTLNLGKSFAAGMLIAWGSKLQPVTSLSSTEAEYYAASVCGVEVLALRNFLRDINADVSLPTPVYVDNSACVNLAKHFSSCRRTKHIDRRVWFLTDYQAAGHIEVLPVTTSANTADIFTKPLPKPLFQFHRSALVS